MKKLIVVISFLAVLFFSCGGVDDDTADPFDAEGVEKKTFYVQNFKTSGTANSVEAGLIVEGKYCHLWAIKGAGVNKKKAQSIANTFDNDIYGKMMENFSFTKEDDVYYNGVKVDTTMDLTNCFVNGDGKLNIILADIADNYQKGVNNAYTAGYFWNGDLLARDSKNPYSNECVAIFIDTYPGVPGSEEANTTLAHEMQHLMSFSNGLLVRDEDFDTWIDEGLSLSAEYLYLGKHPSGRVNHYKNDPSGLIRKGNNFFVWGNRKNESSYASLDDYATAYLFFQWLRLQKGKGIYYSIMFSDANDYNAVVSAYASISSWESLLQTWMASTHINAATGQYGYRGELTDIKAHAAPAETSIKLFPGEGVYSKTSSLPDTSGSGANINYAYLTTNVSASYSAGSTLLTYNKSTINGLDDAIAETGKTTGAASVQVVPNARFIASLSNEPIRMDARDMIGRDNWQKSYSTGISELRKGAKINE